MKRLVSIALALVILLSMFIMPVYAQTNSDYSESAIGQPRFTYIRSTDTNATITNGMVTVMGAMTCHDGTTSCNVTVFLQRRKIGGDSWVNYTFDTGSGTEDCNASVTMTATKGYEYRAKAVFSANNGAETTTAYSVVVQYNPSN